MRFLIFTAVAIAFVTLMTTSPAMATAPSPILSMELAGTNLASETVFTAPSSLQLDLHINTAAHPIEGLQLYVTAQPPYAAAFTLGPSQGPFSSGEITSQAAAGAPASSSTQTALFRSASGDYSANSDYNLLTFTFNTQGLPNGTYVFRSIGTAFVNSTEGASGFSTSTFGAPNDFTLQVVPEPLELALLSFSLFLLNRPRRAD